jgi:transcriptional regulator GlxA family with amidase domain
MTMTNKTGTTKPAPPKAADAHALDVTVVLLEAGYASTAIGPIEVFHSAGKLWNWLQGDPEQPRFRVRIASIDGRAVTSLCALGLTPTCSIDDIRQTDIVILPASGWDVQDQIAHNTALLPWLRKQHAQGAYIAGICSGVGFLAECGLLDGRLATTHWGVAHALRERYPKVNWRPELFVTEDSRLFCSVGVYAAIDISLYLVEKFCGHEVAVQCAKSLLVSMPRSRQSGYAVVSQSRPHSDEGIRGIEEYLRENFHHDVPIDDLAARIGLSSRTFIRRFKAATGNVPHAYLQQLRIAAAREMLERGASSIRAVSTRIGYQDVAFFRALFKRHTGMTPGEYRTSFAGLTYDRGELASGEVACNARVERLARSA